MGGGILDSPSLEVPRVSVAGRDAGRGAGLAADFSVERSTGFSTGLSLNASLSTEAILSKEVAFLKERGGGVSECDWSNLAAMDAVLNGRTVAWVDEEPLRVGEGTGEGMFRLGDAGASRAVAVARVFSHEGGFCASSPPPSAAGLHLAAPLPCAHEPPDAPTVVFCGCCGCCRSFLSIARTTRPPPRQ